MIKCIIVEDQPPAQRILQKYVADTEGLQLEATFSDPVEAVSFLKSEIIDLVFLDVHLPKISGIDFLKILQDPPQIILTTAFEDYALQAYELDVVDYLLKPFSYSRFFKSIEKIKKQHANGTKPKEDTNYVFVKDGHNYLNIQIEDIVYIKAEGDYTAVHKTDERLLVSYSMKYWENRLADQSFFRIHKSFLINVHKVEKISGNVVMMSNGIEVPIGRTYKDAFHARFLN
ncbi:MAG: LytTR family DNA-binding domain-containing protein [Flavobacteriales bacterium]|nr:LytTR family DNA-binding domain-containing protein [Flavobacteriales bacterium]